MSSQKRDTILNSILKYIEIHGFITGMIALRRFEITESQVESYLNILRKRGLIRAKNRYTRKSTKEPFQWVLGEEPKVASNDSPKKSKSQKAKSWGIKPFQHWEPLALFYGIKGKLK